MTRTDSIIFVPVVSGEKKKFIDIGNRKAKKKGPLGPISGPKYPKLNYKCTGFWKEDHGHVSHLHLLYHYIILFTI